jgi:hypothetical protein
MIRDILGVMCPGDKAVLADLKTQGVTITAYDRIHSENPCWDGTKWELRPFEASGTATRTRITMIKDTAKENASTLYHEGIHAGQPPGMAPLDAEIDAYAKEDEWRKAHGNMDPVDPSFRKNGVTDKNAIAAWLPKEYPWLKPANSSGVSEWIAQIKPDGTVHVHRSDGSEVDRPPRKDECKQGAMIREPPTGMSLDVAKIQCP